MTHWVSDLHTSAYVRVTGEEVPTGSVSTSRGLRGLIDIYIVDMYQVWMLGPQVSKFTDNGEHTDIMIQIGTPQVSLQVGIPYPLYLLWQSYCKLFIHWDTSLRMI